MLTCIACSKQQQTTGSLPEDHCDSAAPSPKQPIRTLTAQIRDMAVKASGAYKNCGPCSSSSNRAYMDSERFYGSYRRAGTGSAMSSPRLWGKDMLKAFSSGFATPASVSSRSEPLVFMEEDEPKEWVAQVEPGVLITFISLPQSGNDIKRIRFSREIFNKWQAQRWWAENCDRVIELYNVQKLDHHAVPLPTSPRSEDEISKVKSTEESPVTPRLSKEHLPRHFNRPTGISCASPDSVEHHPMHRHYYDPNGINSTPKLSSASAAKTETSSIDASARSSYSRETREHSVSNASDLESEWAEEDEPGVYITIQMLPGGARELRRVRFSREMFGETQARLWWESNKARIQQQYL